MIEAKNYNVAEHLTSMDVHLVSFLCNAISRWENDNKKATCKWKHYMWLFYLNNRHRTQSGASGWLF